jgi:energy-coupling factor transport system permease protein
MGLPLLLSGSVLAALGIHHGGRRTGRSRYRPDPWALPEWLVAGCGVAAAAAAFAPAATDPASLFLASVTDPPPVPLLATLGILVALLPAVLAPPLPRPEPLPAPDERRMEVAA